MKKRLRLLAALCAILYVSSFSVLVVPASATGTVQYTTDSNFWHFLNGGHGPIARINRFIGGGWLSYIPATGVCSNSNDSKHHASSVTGVSDDGYCICVCEDCGNEFTSSTRAQDIYDDYTDTLPAKVINSDGGFVWKPSFSDVSNIYMCFDNDGSSYYHKVDFTLNSSNSFSYSDSHYEGNANVSFKDNYSLNVYSCTKTWEDVVVYRIDFVLPVTGTYTSLSSPCFVGYKTKNGSDVPMSNDWPVVQVTSYSLSKTITFNAKRGTVDNGNQTPYNGVWYMPVFNVVPETLFDVTSTSSNDTYNINTRAASISGDYGIVTQSGDIQKIDSQTIVNETNNTYYSPSTGEPQGFIDWTYDYSDRSYTLTTTEGNTTTITYGDEYTTINEGGNVTNIYYLTEVPGSEESGDNGENSGSGSSSGSLLPHFHQYTSVITSAPDCTLPGVKTYTCGCGDTYTEVIPALGHSWVVKNRVPTTYDDETAELLEQGYTVYQCSVCGEQYRSDDGSAPPNSYIGGSADSGTSGGTIWGKLGTLLGTIALAPLRVIESILGVLLDGLISLAQVITERLGTLLEMVLGWFDTLPDLFSGFTSFLSAVFVFLPEEMITLLVFGLAAVVFVAIIKAIRGR